MAPLFTSQAHSNEVTCIAEASKGKTLCSASRDRTICVWLREGADGESGALVLLKTLYFSISIHAAAFANDDRDIILTSSSDVFCITCWQLGEGSIPRLQSQFRSTLQSQRWHTLPSLNSEIHDDGRRQVHKVSIRKEVTRVGSFDSSSRRVEDPAETEARMCFTKRTQKPKKNGRAKRHTEKDADANKNVGRSEERRGGRTATSVSDWQEMDDLGLLAPQDVDELRQAYIVECGQRARLPAALLPSVLARMSWESGSPTPHIVKDISSSLVFRL